MIFSSLDSVGQVLSLLSHSTQWSGVYPKEINQVLTDTHTKKTSFVITYKRESGKTP